MNRQKPPAEQGRGFTLVELMISVAVITLLAGMAAQTFRAVLTAREVAMRRMEINETARATLDYMATELRSAYLTPDSVKPVGVVASSSENTGPRFRFAGINRDVVVEPDSKTPGAGKDDDGDGLIDEEVLDGVDGDYNDGAAAALKGASPIPDPLGCEPGDQACIDEDIGLFPSDILHFVSAVESSGTVILQEISYGLNPAGTRLVRRAQVLQLDSSSSSSRQQLLDFGQFIDDSSRKLLLPPAVPIGQIVRQSAVQQAINNWDDGAEDGQIGQSNNNSQNPGNLFQVLAYDVRGLRFQYWYYDYNRGGWRMAQEWDSSRETALLSPSEKIFNKFAANNSLEGNSMTSFANVIVNEPEDMYPRMAGSTSRFLISDPRQLRNAWRNPQRNAFYELYQKIAARTDGLPDMIEITIYVQDRDRSYNPKTYSTRVFLPNNYRTVGSL
ncbi:MAG: prepilin-type N-terminal cleavage/methylation domain-containing protein [Candidatus Omnitrophica bacterium]|nr:prepilin-type N-terminal cleavage/methylation domain-containing protein [Candidatus Omnitrophota bacterium]